MTADARLAREDGTIVREPRSRVPVRTIAATIGMVLLTAVVLLLGWEVRRVLTWIVVAALLAIILGPLVDITQRRLHLRRALATLLVFLVALIALTGILTTHSLPAAIVVLVVSVVYQQVENHVLQPVIMSRTVELSALTVLVSILIGVELFGFLGALLAIPVAGVLHVIGRDLYDSYRGRLKPEPTTGTDEIPVSQPRPLEPAEQSPSDVPATTHR